LIPSGTEVLSPLYSVAVPTLAIAVIGDTFESLWAELAKEHRLELLVVASTAEISPSPDLLPPVLVCVGREEDSEAEVRSIRDAGLPAPIVIGGAVDHRVAVRVVQAGAIDYLVLPADLPAFRSLIADHVGRIARRVERHRLLESTRTDYDFSQIVSRSPAMMAALERAARVIPHHRASVLITGETGTGKELVAQAIHYNSSRALGAFVDVNCAAIPANLIESELFGYERGAFTDARSAKPGLFEAADGGTLFLDEIGHLPLSVQGKLLKALEEKRVRRLGSLQSRTVDLRIIAATHVDLAAAVQGGEFREDLYYRLTIIPIHLPPLRERGDDVLLIAQHFLDKLSEQYGLAPPVLDEKVRNLLLSYSWPGNVRELRNALERALLLGGGRLDRTDLFYDVPVRGTARAGSLPFPATLAEIEKGSARLMVERFDGNKSAAATALGISRSRLYRLLDEPEPESSRLPAMENREI
jgi:DNA-binding NtrC family response regulator